MTEEEHKENRRGMDRRDGFRAGDEAPRTREGDGSNKETAQRIFDARREGLREGRKRTIFMSVVITAVVTLFLNNVDDASRSNDQTDRDRTNCSLIQGAISTLADEKHDSGTNNNDPEIRARQLKYEKLYRLTLPPAAAACEDIFPKEKVFSLPGF